MAVFALSISVPAALGPFAAGIVLDNYRADLLWHLSALLCAIAAGGFYALHVKLGEQPRFLAIEAEHG
jgi:MFS family permease